MSAQFILLFAFGILTIATVITGWLAWRVTTAREIKSKKRVEDMLAWHVGPRDKDSLPDVSVRKIR